MISVDSFEDYFGKFLDFGVWRDDLEGILTEIKIISTMRVVTAISRQTPRMRSTEVIC